MLFRSCIRLDSLDDEPKLPVENEAQASLAQLAEHALRKRTVVGSIATGGYASFTLRATHAGCSYARDSMRCGLRASATTAFLAPSAWADWADSRRNNYHGSGFPTSPWHGSDVRSGRDA